MATRSFNLRLWFAVSSLGIIAILCVASALWLTSYLTASLLEREGKLSQEFLESVVNVNGRDTFRDDGPVATSHNTQLLDLSKHLLSMPGALRINVHAPSRRIIWSTEKQLVGKVFEGSNDELDEAFNGKIVTEISDLEGDLKPEHIALGASGKMIESYIPVRADAGLGPIIGVVEFYRLPLSLERTLASGRRMVWLGAGGAALVLFLVLYWIVQRGAVIIESQQNRLGRMEALAAIGQMASAVAHSLRNPMSAIRSSAELWQAELPVADRQVTQEVIAEVDRMDDYVRDLLAYARAEPYMLQPVDPRKVIDRVLQKLRCEAQRRLVVEVGGDAPAGARVLADEMLLEQALTSLVTNAIEAMPDGGVLDLRIDIPVVKRMVRISIVDNGRGIPADLLNRVAESYFTTKTRGLGLGLVLAKGVIERFGGSLGLVSSPDRGTTVHVTLKAA